MGAINGSKTNWPRPAEPLASVFARHGKGICATPLFYSPKGLGRRAGASGAVGEAPAAGDTASRHRNAAMKIPGISTTLPTGTGRSRCCVPGYAFQLQAKPFVLSETQIEWHKRQLLRSCVGITASFLGFTVDGAPYLGQCYATLPEALKAR